MEIAPKIYSLPAGRGEFMGLFPPNVYLVAGRRAALIDAGYGDPEAVGSRLDFIRNFSLAYILITHAHPDHIGGAEEFRRATGAVILAHPEESVSRAEGKLEDGQVLDLEGAKIRVVHTPGHTRGHLCFLAEEAGVLFTGDHILGLGTTVIRPHQGDMGEYMESLRKLLDLPLKLIAPGHGPVVRQPQAKVRELLQHREERERQVLDCLRRGIGDIPGMVREIYPELDGRLIPMAREQVLAHLMKLVKEGRAEEKDGGYHIV